MCNVYVLVHVCVQCVCRCGACDAYTEFMHDTHMNHAQHITTMAFIYFFTNLITICALPGSHSRERSYNLTGKELVRKKIRLAHYDINNAIVQKKLLKVRLSLP